MTTKKIDRVPYPGLRSFRRAEADLFFGREDQVDDVIDRLAAARFVSVLGASGSGKSSLARTGVLEGLELGLLRDPAGPGGGSEKTEDSSNTLWQIADFRPGDKPIANLARALLESRAFLDRRSGDTGEILSEQIEQSDVDALAAMLRRGPRSIIQWCGLGYLKPGASLLILVDQFEELFNYQSYSGQDQAQAFVNLLIESASQTSTTGGDKRLPVYVLLTMRSEFLGACALIDGLAEAINRGQYLTPRLSRKDCETAITQPAKVQKFVVEPDLVARLLNDLATFAPWDDVEDSPASGAASTAKVDQLERLARRADQLPLLQHVLNRLWTKSRDNCDDPPTLTLAEYERRGGLRGMLSEHADEILDKLASTRGKGIRRVAESVFRALVTGASVATAVRRPTSIGQLVEVAPGERADVLAVIDAYRAPGCNFLVANAERLADGVKIDISHESLIRQWGQLRHWVEKEASAASWWRAISGLAANWVEAGKQAHAEASSQALWERMVERFRRYGMLLRGTALTQALRLNALYAPTPAWAGQYGGGFDAFDNYLRKSQRVAKRRHYLYATAAACILVATSLAMAMVFVWAKEKEERQVSDMKHQDRLVDTMLSQVVRFHSADDPAHAGAILSGFLSPIIGSLDPKLKLPSVEPRRSEQLLQALRAQYLALRRDRYLKTLNSGGTSELRSGSGPVGATNDHRFEVGPSIRPRYSYPYLGFGDPGLIAAVQDKTVRIHRANPDGTWQAAKILDLATSIGAVSLANSSGVAFFDSGNSLAIIDNDVLFYGPTGHDASNKLRKARIERRATDIATSRQQLEGAPAPRAAPFSTLFACHNSRPHFVAHDANGASWLIIADGERASAQKLIEGGSRLFFSFDLDTHLFALGSEDRVVVGRCERPESEAAFKQVETSTRASIEDIEFTEPGILAIVQTTDEVRFIDVRGSTPQQVNGTPITIPSGRKYFRVATHRRLLLGSSDGKTMTLWNPATQEDVVVFPGEDGKALFLVGFSDWLATVSGDDQVVVRRPMPQSAISTADLAKIVATAGGSDLSDDMADVIRDSHEILARNKLPVISADRPAGRFLASSDCTSRLEQLVDAIERTKADQAMPPQDGAKGACESAATAQDDKEERALFGWLAQNANSVLVNPEQLRPRVAGLAARGSALGLRLLAISFRELPDVALALRAQAAEASGRPALPVLDWNRRVADDVGKGPQDIVGIQRLEMRPLAFRDGRYQENAGLWFYKRGAYRQALQRFATAQRYYAEVGDDEGIRSTGRRRLMAAAQLEDRELLELANQPAPEPREAVRAKIAAPSERPLHADLAAIAEKQTPLVKAELLLAAAEAAPADGANTKLGLLKGGIDALAEARARKQADSARPAVAPRLARALAQRGATDLGAVVVARYLEEVGERYDAEVEAGGRIAEYSIANAILDALRIANATNAAGNPDARSSLSSMGWNFVKYTWGSNRNSLLLAEADKLLKALLEINPAVPELQLAAARTSFWRGTAAPPASKQDFFDRAVFLFKNVPDPDLQVRSEYADAVRVQGSVMLLDDPKVTPEGAVAVVEARMRARTLYDEILPKVKDLPKDTYLRTAAIFGMSSTLQALATAHAVATAKLLNEPEPHKAYQQAVGALRATYDQRTLFDPDQFGDIDVKHPTSRNLCCLAPESQGEDGWVVALVAGAISAALADGTVGACEKEATHPYDPRRRVPEGELKQTTIETCKKEGIGLKGEDAARNAFLLGRAYAVLREDRDEAIKQLSRAADFEYPQAFFNLYFALNARRRCDITPALIDRYRYLVMRDSLAPVLRILAPYFSPDDADLQVSLRDLARREPTTTNVLPRKTKTKEVDYYSFVTSKCE